MTGNGFLDDELKSYAATFLRDPQGAIDRLNAAWVLVHGDPVLTAKTRRAGLSLEPTEGKHAYPTERILRYNARQRKGNNND